MDSEEQTQPVTEEVPAAGKLLSNQERQVCERLAIGDAPEGQWARALLAIDEGASRAEAAQRAGLTSRQVRYWLTKFRKLGLDIFSKQALESAAEELVALPVAPKEEELVVESSEEAGESDATEALEANVEELKIEPKAKKSKDKKKKKKDKKGKGKKKGGKKQKSKGDKPSKKSKKAGKKKSKKDKR